MNKRGNDRDKGYAKVLIDHRIPGYLRDLSPSGLRIDSLKKIEQPEVELRIIPEESLNIEDFTVKGRLVWERKEGLFHLYGITFSEELSSRASKLFKRLGEFYQ